MFGYKLQDSEKSVSLKEAVGSLAAAIMTMVMMAANLTVPFLAKRLGKRNLCIVPAGLQLLGLVIIWPGDLNTSIIVVGAFISAAGYGVKESIYFSMQADSALVRELYPVCKKQMYLTLKMIDSDGRLITDDNYPVVVDWSNGFSKDTAGQTVNTTLRLKCGADTFREAFDPDKPDYSPYGSPIVNSCCHAWSCAPVYLISKYLLS